MTDPNPRRGVNPAITQTQADIVAHGGDVKAAYPATGKLPLKDTLRSNSDLNKIFANR